MAGDEAAPPGGDEADRREIELVFARCFAGPDGQRVLAHLRRATLERTLAPDASEAALRHMEGQRALVLRIAALIERGRA